MAMSVPLGMAMAGSWRREGGGGQVAPPKLCPCQAEGGAATPDLGPSEPLPRGT